MVVGLLLGQIFWPLCMLWCEGTSGGYYPSKVPQRDDGDDAIAISFCLSQMKYSLSLRE